MNEIKLNRRSLLRAFGIGAGSVVAQQTAVASGAGHGVAGVSQASGMMVGYPQATSTHNPFMDLAKRVQTAREYLNSDLVRKRVRNRIMSERVVLDADLAARRLPLVTLVRLQRERNFQAALEYEGQGFLRFKSGEQDWIG